MNKNLDYLRYETDYERQLVYYNPWRRRTNFYPTVWSTNKMPGIMSNNNACMQYNQTSPTYSNTPVYTSSIYDYIVQPPHNTNTFYNSQPVMYVEPESAQSPNIQELQLPVAEYLEPKREFEVHLPLGPVVIKDELQDEFNNEFNPTESLLENPEATYNSLLPKVMNEVNKRIGTLDVELPNISDCPPFVAKTDTTESGRLTKTSDGNSIKYQNGENMGDPTQLNSSMINLLSSNNTNDEKDTLPLGLTANKQKEVIKAAKSLFSKRTRTLLHWLNPNSNKSQLKGNVTAAWDTLPDREKNFYFSQVLGKFALHNSSLMVNPQLGTAQSTPAPVPSDNSTSTTADEDRAAVANLYRSCGVTEKRIFRKKYKKTASKKGEFRKKYSKKFYSEKAKEKCLFSYDPDLEHELRLLKKMKENCQGLDEFKDDSELVKEIEKFGLMNEEIDEDFWDNAPDPDDLFSDLGF